MERLKESSQMEVYLCIKKKKAFYMFVSDLKESERAVALEMGMEFEVQ